MNEKRTGESPYELGRIRDLINRVQHSIVDVKKQAPNLEWLGLYLALYFLRNSESVAPSIQGFTDYLESSFQWNQSINVYGIIKGKYEYINTCEIDQLEVLLNCLKANWYDNVVIELFNEPGQMISVAEVLTLLDKLLKLPPTQLQELTKLHNVF